jgi:hypothetical protein
MVIRVELANPRHPDVRKLLPTGHAAIHLLVPCFMLSNPFRDRPG